VWDRYTVPTQLWHYTDGAGILGIAKSRLLWCTEYRHLNDKAEISTFARQLQSFLREQLKARLSAGDVDQLIETSELYKTWNVFIASFCADADRNEHWSQYARKAGYALGFDPNGLRALARQQGFVLAPVLYGEQTAFDIATGVVSDQTSILDSFKSPLKTEDLRKLCRFVCDLILTYAPFFKPKAFERENEWRLIRTTGIQGGEQINFRSSKVFGLLGYYEFNLAPQSNRRGTTRKLLSSQLIPRVMVGPGNESEELRAVTNVSELLEQNGFETTVSASKSSLRFMS
jgi:hypothetical protein